MQILSMKLLLTKKNVIGLKVKGKATATWLKKTAWK